VTEQGETMPEPQWNNAEPDGYTTAPVDLEWSQAHPLERRPQALDGDSKLANHLLTISFTPKGQPMIVVRGNSGSEITELLGELDQQGVYMQLAQAQQQLASSAPPAETIMRQLGATPMPQQAAPGAYSPQQPTQGYAPQGQQWGPPGPPQPSPGQPPFGGPTGGYAPPAPVWGGGANQPPARPQGWFAVKVPFAANAAAKAVRDQLEAQGLKQGNVKWEGDTKTWLVSPAVVQWFAQWNPSPA